MTRAEAETMVADILREWATAIVEEDVWPRSAEGVATMVVGRLMDGWNLVTMKAPT